MQTMASVAAFIDLSQCYFVVISRDVVLTSIDYYTAGILIGEA